jgi:uncharacterized membrane protein
VALIEFPDPPEGSTADQWRDDIASRVLLLIVGATCFLLGRQVWSAASTGEGVLWAVPSFGAFLVGLVLLALAQASIDLRAHARTICYAVLGALAGVTVLAAVVTGWPARIGTDALMFSSYGTELALAGKNPMSQSMRAAAGIPGGVPEWTFHADGSIVDDWSYPAGMVWALAPQYATVGRWPIGLRLTSLVWAVGFGVVVIRALPAIYAPAGLLSLLVPQNILLTHLGGLIDVFWLLPTAAALILWYAERWVAAAAVLGVACSMKQQPMFILPFLAVWVLKTTDGWRAFGRRAAACCGAGVLTFGALNAPFVFADPAAWLSSVFVPLGGGEVPLASRGVGLAAFSEPAGVALPRWAHYVALGAVGVGGLLAYARWFESVKWVAWVAPAVLLLWAPRSLPSYFAAVVPLAMLGLFAARGRLAVRRRGVTA